MLSVILAVTTVTVAFADFSPENNPKILGVGRIQNTLPDTPVAPEGKFALASPEDTSERSAELVEPIAREVAPVIIPEPVIIEEPAAPIAREVAPVIIPEPVIIEEPAAAEDDSAISSANGWRTTLATNYATPADGFLNCQTASGTYTSTTSMGVAHKNLPLGTVVEIYCPRTGLSCIATVDDRGPYDGRADTFDFQMGVTAALGDVYGWYQVMYRIVG